MKKILLIGTGGTIACTKGDTIHLDTPFKILDYVRFENVEFESASPFTVLSENMSINLWKRLIEYLSGVVFSQYTGVIILHGSDTLAFTSSVIANAFPNENIVFVAADKPVEDKESNGIRNFNNAVECLLSQNRGVCVSYNGIHRADAITSANIKDEFCSLESTLPPLNSKIIYDKNILIVNPYVEINFDNYNLENLDGVLINMFHSATVPDSAKEFSKKLRQRNIPCFFVTHKQSADYETAQGINNIIFNCTIENAYARMLLIE